MRDRPGIRRLFRPPWRSAARVAREVDDELQFHLDARAGELRADAATTAEAVRRAREEFGDVAVARARLTRDGVRHLRRERAGRWLREVAQDVRYATRQLRRDPGFTLVAALTLALGVGATTAIFSAVDGVLLRPLPYTDADRTVALLQRDAASADADGSVAPGNFLDWRERSRTLGPVAAAVPRGFDVIGAGATPETVRGWGVTEGFFDALAARPVHGRLFLPDEYVPYGESGVVVIGHGYWQRRFGGDPGAVGQVLSLDGRPHVVVGVLPPSYRFPAERDLWAPMTFGEDARRERSGGYIHVVGRLAPGATVAQAQAELDDVSQALAREHPRTNARVAAAVVPLADHVVAGVRPGLLLLLAAVGGILLIACVNVANLLLARGARRRRELAVRGALGAGRGRLVRQLLTESLLLAAIGGAAGVLLAHGALRLLLATVPVALPATDPVRVDVRVLLFAVVLTAATALLFGLAPAVRFSRADVRGGLAGAARRGDPAARRLRRVLVATEIALAVVLLVGAGLLGRSLHEVLRVELGFQADNRLAVQVFLWDQVETAAERIQLLEQVGERVGALPDVRAVGATSALPFLADRIDIEAPVAVEGREAAEGEGPKAYATVATPGYFAAMQIPLRDGRLLDADDRDDTPRVVVVNEAFARRYFPGERAVGRRIRVSMADRPVPREIVGVVADVRQTRLEAAAEPEFWVPHAQSGFGSMTIVVRTRDDPAAMRATIERELWALAPDLPLYDVQTMEGLLDTAVAGRRFGVLLVGGLAGLALLLAAVGVYGVASVTARERLHEFGVRAALGARARHLLALSLGEGLRVALTGVAAGALGAAALAGVVRARLYGVAPSDPLTYGAVAATLVLVALVACWLPARRAARVPPSTVLRAD